MATRYEIERQIHGPNAKYNDIQTYDHHLMIRALAGPLYVSANQSVWLQTIESDWVRFIGRAVYHAQGQNSSRAGHAVDGSRIPHAGEIQDDRILLASVCTRPPATLRRVTDLDPVHLQRRCSSSPQTSARRSKSIR